MPRKYDKRWLVEQITVLRASGFTKDEIRRRLGVARSYMGQIIRDFAIPRVTGRKRARLCPHCGLDQNSHSALNGAGDVRPKES